MAWKRFTARISKCERPAAKTKVLPVLHRQVLQGAAALLLGIGGWTVAAAENAAPAKARHVVLISWDGMRPDFINAANTPTLHALAEKGTFFLSHHSVYVTSTEVNGTAMATGCYPNRSGIMANREYRPDLQLTRPIGTEDLAFMRLGDALTDGKYVAMPTIAEAVRAAGFPTVIAGTKPVVALHDRDLKRKSNVEKQSVLLYAGATLPREALRKIQDAIGEFPSPPEEPLVPNNPQNDWTTRALTEVLWRDGVPKFTLLWLGDPDYTQHQIGPGSDAALKAIRADDDNLAKVLAALDAKGVRDETDIFVVSDHGFSTVDRMIDLPGMMKKAGFNVLRAFHQTPRPDDILMVNLGGSESLYVQGHDRALIQRLVDFLQNSDFAGAIFTREVMPGTFALRDARVDTAEAPDILFSFRWTNARNRFGTPGSFVSDALAGRRPGFGTHASLSPFDFHNTLVAAGPDIRSGLQDSLPSANVDLAPTILHLLGIPTLRSMDGRVLREALVGDDYTPPQPEVSTIEATRQFGDKTWRQYLKYTSLGDYLYLDEGNGGRVVND